MTATGVPDDVAIVTVTELPTPICFSHPLRNTFACDAAQCSRLQTRTEQVLPPGGKNQVIDLTNAVINYADRCCSSFSDRNCKALSRQGRKTEAGSIARAPASEIETIVHDIVSKQLAERLPDDAQGQRELFRQIGLRVSIHSKTLELTWQRTCSDEQQADAEALTQKDCETDLMQRVSYPYVVLAHKRRRAIILPTDASSIRPIRQQEQQNLARSIAQGRGWLREILGGTTILVIAERESRSPRMIRMMLSLAFLDPRLVRAVLHGDLPRGVSTRKMVDAPALWHEQWQAIGLSRPT